MADQETTRVRVPETVGDELTIRWDGDDPTTYAVNGGEVAIENQYVDRFINLVDGSERVDTDDNTSSSGSTDTTSTGAAFADETNKF